jgi:hypothetical protein
MRDLVRVLNFEREQGKKLKSFSYLLQKILDDKVTATSHTYCKECRKVMSISGGTLKCVTTGCFSKGAQNGRFLTLSLAEQWKDIVEGFNLN